MDNYMFENLSKKELEELDGGGLFGLVGGAIIGGVVGTLAGAAAAVVVKVSGGSQEQVSNCLGAGFVAGVTYGAYSGAAVSGPF